MSFFQHLGQNGLTKELNVSFDCVLFTKPYVQDQLTNKYSRGDISVSYYWFYNFPNQFIWCSVWICIACFLYHMFSLFCCAVKWIRKGIPTKTWKYLFHLNKFENDSEFFWTEHSDSFIAKSCQIFCTRIFLEV